MSPLRDITPNKIKTLDRLACEYCKLGFDQEAALQAHAREHDATSGNKCRLCESSFSSKWNLRRHIERRHNEELVPGKTVKMKEVKEEEEVKAEPDDEESKENKSEITAFCDICNKGFRGRLISIKDNKTFVNHLYLLFIDAGSKIWRGIETTFTQAR